MKHPSAFVRRQAVAGAESLARAAKPESMPQFARDLAKQAIADPDLRVRQSGISLLALSDPSACVAAAAKEFSSSEAALERATWAQSIAANDGAFAAFRAAKFPGGNGLLLGVAGQRADTSLAAAMRPTWREAVACEVSRTVICGARSDRDVHALGLYRRHDRDRRFARHHDTG